jgi:hypothetical protein
MSDLRVVCLSHNSFSGPAPSFQHNTALEALGTWQKPFLSSAPLTPSLSDLGYNQFSGPLPAGLRNLLRLNGINCQHNMFEGPLLEIDLDRQSRLR